MHFHVHSHAPKSPPVIVHMRCQRCLAETTGVGREHVESVNLLFVIPIFKKHTVFVRCNSCGSEFLSRIGLETLAGYDGNDVGHHLVPRSDETIAQFLAMGALVASCIPFLGLPLALAAIGVTIRTGGWARTVGIIAAILSTIASVGLVLILRAGRP